MRLLREAPQARSACLFLSQKHQTALQKKELQNGLLGIEDLGRFLLKPYAGEEVRNIFRSGFRVGGPMTFSCCLGRARAMPKNTKVHHQIDVSCA